MPNFWESCWLLEFIELSFPGVSEYLVLQPARFSVVSRALTKSPLPAFLAFNLRGSGSSSRQGKLTISHKCHSS